MRAIVKTPGSPATLCDWSPPPQWDGVRIRVNRVGLCRTDLYVADDKIPISGSLVLGHEFSGTVINNDPLPEGTRVGVNPLFGRKFMGVAFDGALCEEIVVPRCQVHLVPDNVSFTEAAYLEPVAASMAVLNVDLQKGWRIAVTGHNRIAELTRIILKTHGYSVEIFQNKEDYYDCVVETTLSTETVPNVVGGLKPNGTLIIKSRRYIPVEICLGKLVAKEIIMRAVNYAPFDDAMAWISNHGKAVHHLFGNTYPFESFEDAFEEARDSEANKIFITVEDGVGS